MRSRIMYIELKTGFNDNGPARIGRVSFSRTFQTIYYRGKIFQRLHGGGVAGNWVDVHTGEEYWISGVKKSRRDRHWARGGPVEIDDDVRDDYHRLVSET
jgi:hypothetical protein